LKTSKNAIGRGDNSIILIFRSENRRRRNIKEARAQKDIESRKGGCSREKRTVRRMDGTEQWTEWNFKRFAFVILRRILIYLIIIPS